ncbi:hypothetical protein ACF07V_08470 [Streptomyces sp. NPDC015661]|uniref:hypothetical protein n=1 Tax=Streptomyces sp. NPDC015661 TaxID=3364961 RepID=UPI003701D892
MDVERRQVPDVWTLPACRPEAVSWRLVGANNHELGRGPELHRGHAACSAAVTRLRAGLDRAVPHVAMTSADGTWTWQLAVDQRCVAVSARAFRRQRECRDSLGLFLAAAVEGQVAEGVTYTRRMRGLRLPDAVQGNVS